MTHGPRRARPTLRTVADLAGVSIATASNVLSGRDDGRVRVSGATRSTVLAVAERVGYVPNRAAQAVRTGRTRVVQLALNAMSDPWSWALAEAVAARSRREGLVTSVLVGGDWYGSLRLQDGDVAFVDAVDDTDETRKRLEELAHGGRRLIVMSQVLEPDGIDIVRSDPLPGCRLAVRHLLGLSHDLGCLTHRSAIGTGLSRHGVYREELEAAGVAYDPTRVETFENTPASAFAAAVRLLSAPRRPRGVYATTDFAGRAVISAAQALGLRVPDDVLVTGAGNSPDASTVSPTLTTAGPVGFFDAVADLVVARALDDEAPRLHEFTWTLHVGGSTVRPHPGG